MAVSSLMYDDGEYEFDEFAEIFALFVRDGYVAGIDDELIVSECSPVAMAVSVGSGRARIQGYWYKNDDDNKLTITASNPTYDRIDRVVLRLVTDSAPRGITAAVLTGTASATPEAPVLTQTAALYEISLAQILVEAAATTISAEDITDERDDYDVCGQATAFQSDFTKIIAPTEDIDCGGQKIVNLPAPSADTDIARKAYYDSVIGEALGANKFEIVPVFGAVPSGWLECNGAAVSRATYDELFAAWGTTFGSGDGSTTFNLPDLSGRLVYGATDTIGTTGGAKTVTLDNNGMAAHTHLLSGTGATISVFQTDTGYGSYYGGTVATTMTNAGTGGAHNNLSPYMALRFMVRAS